MDFCAPGGVLVVPSVWAADYYGTDGNTKQLTDAKVSITSGNYNSVYGGYDDHDPALGIVQNNKVSFSGAVAEIVWGGYNDNGNVENNTVIIDNSTVKEFKFGASILGGNVYGGYANEGNAVKNIVTIGNSRIENGVLGGFSRKENAEENVVTIDNSTIQ